MLRSMTAYGRSSLKTERGEFVCELRSVNHRYLDIAIRLPQELRSLETNIREILSPRLQRGKVEVLLQHTASGDTGTTLSINEPLLGQIVEAANRVAALGTGTVSLDPVSLLQWPGVVTSSNDLDDRVVEDALVVFRAALDDFILTREREGQQIADLLSKKALQVSEHVQSMRRYRPNVLARQRGKWLAKLATLTTDYDKVRLEQELLYAAQRLDIDEELDRLDAHIAELGNALQRQEAVGRRLDFLMQEFNREANTLASKSADSQTTNGAVNMKVLIEQMREQVQNVE